MEKRRLFISFSGGATSGFMSWACLHINAIRERYSSVKVIFANTGCEHERTLEFVQECNERFSLKVVWVEAVVHKDSRRAPSSRVVDFKSASRNGEPFEAVIAKYGIPNMANPACTRDTKLAPIHHYLRAHGWEKGTYDTAIGIRVDEFDRISSQQKERRIVYPLISWLPTTKAQVAAWWEKMPFQLGLPEHHGNCVWCWKKTLRKHYMLLDEDPNALAFPDRMEKTYGQVGYEFLREGNSDGRPRVFFRGEKSAQDLIQLHRSRTALPEVEELAPGGCGESCEVFSDAAGDTHGE